MLAAELKKYSQEVRRAGGLASLSRPRRRVGELRRPVRGPQTLVHAPLPICRPLQVPRPTPAAGGCSDAMGSLHLGPGAGGGGICSQSLPSHSHMSMHTLVQPRLRPSPAPSFAGVPLMVRPRCHESATRLTPPFHRPPSRADRRSRGPPHPVGWVKPAPPRTQ